jgi:Fe-S oxidoreductase
MAGSFGYEHGQLSLEIGEISLFPAIKDSPEETFVSTSGFSCRHQIKDGTGRHALHPIEILNEALIQKSDNT